MTQAGSQVCYLQVVRHVLDSLEVPVDYLSRMTWTTLIFLAHLLLTMLILLIPNSGILFYLVL